MTQSKLQNQAIATVQATFTPDGLVLADGRKPRTYLHPRAKTWLSNKMLPLQFDGTFRVWPRYNRDGLKSFTIVGIAPKEPSGIVSGKVISVDGERVTVLVQPKSDRINPFHVQLINREADLKPKRGWRSRFEVIWQDGELVITGSQPLNQSKSKRAPATPEAAAKAAAPAAPKPQPQPQPVSDAEQVARQNYASLIAQARSASDPRMKRQFESLAAAVLRKAGLKEGLMP